MIIIMIEIYLIKILGILLIDKPLYNNNIQIINQYKNFRIIN